MIWIEHFSLLATLCHSCVSSSMCVMYLREGGYPSIYTRQDAVLEAIFGTKHALHRLCMLRRHRPTKGWLSNAGRGATAPREQPVPDRASSPPPSRGRPWARHGLLPWGALPILSWFGGCLPYSFVQIGVGKCLSVKSSMYLCLWPSK
jgi:hypothetical protein